MKVKLNGNDFFEVSSPFGSIDSIHKTAHTGIDLVMNSGTNLFSPVDGVIKKVVDYGNENIGKGVLIETDEHKTVILGHLSDVKVKIGQTIHEGELVALSGNTGRSTGSHLHLGYKDSNGNFINPEPLLNDNLDLFPQKEGIIPNLININSNDNGGFVDFIREWRLTGSFWEAMYGKSFLEVMSNFTFELLKDLYFLIISNGEVIFIIPAIIIMFLTFFIGRNKFTKWIIPLWVSYFISVLLEAIHCLPPS